MTCITGKELKECFTMTTGKLSLHRFTFFIKLRVAVCFRVLYFSIHRYEYGTFWPNLKESNSSYVGEGKGRGFNINVPLNTTGLSDLDYFAIVTHLLLPVAYEASSQFCQNLIAYTGIIFASVST